MSEEIVPDEVIIGRHESGIMLEEGLKTGNRNYCSKCKSNVHCHVEVSEGIATIIKSCSNSDCVCRCRTHYACKNYGRLHPYGVACKCKDEERKVNKNSEKVFQKLMKNWRKDHKDIMVKKKDV